MKKSTLFLSMMLFLSAGFSQNLLHDNGPLITDPGAGSGGADVSALHDSMTIFGFGHALSAGYRIADDFVVPAGATWTIDSLIFFAYQTNSGNASSIAGVSCALYDDSPATTGAIIMGDETTNILYDTYWSGIYRTNAASFTNVARPIMRNVLVPPAPWVLTGGTYWLSWQTDGNAGFSGPWCPPITMYSQTITGNSIQYNGTSWVDLIDTVTAGASNDAAQGLPFELWGSAVVGVNDISQNHDLGISQLFPVPAKDKISFTVNSLKNSEAVVSIKDAVGRIVLTETRAISEGKSRISYNVSGISPGVYFVSVSTRTSEVNSKFVKQE